MTNSNSQIAYATRVHLYNYNIIWLKITVRKLFEQLQHVVSMCRVRDERSPNNMMFDDGTKSLSIISLLTLDCDPSILDFLFQRVVSHARCSVATWHVYAAPCSSRPYLSSVWSTVTLDHIRPSRSTHLSSFRLLSLLPFFCPLQCTPILIESSLTISVLLYIVFCSLFSILSTSPIVSCVCRCLPSATS